VNVYTPRLKNMFSDSEAVNQLSILCEIKKECKWYFCDVLRC